MHNFALMSFVRNDFFSFLLLFITISFGQSLLAATLTVNLKYIIEDGTRDNAKISILKDGAKWRTLISKSKKESIQLDLQHEYIFTFSKPSYISKKIFFSTRVPENITAQEAKAISCHLTITVYKQPDRQNLIVYNQPVGKIIYKKEIDNFDYDTDYSSSVLSELTRVEKARQSSKNSEINNMSANTQNSPAVLSGNNPSANSQYDSKVKSDFPDAIDWDDDHIEKLYTEGHRHVTETTIRRYGQNFVFKKVVYFWGGVYYFRNSTNITESAYIQETRLGQ